MCAHVCAMEFYSAVKDNEIVKFVGKWIQLENILNEVTQSGNTNASCSLLCVDSSSKFEHTTRSIQRRQ